MQNKSRRPEKSAHVARVSYKGQPKRCTRLELEILEERNLLSAGFLDPTFGVGGSTVYAIHGSQPNVLTDIATQPDGKIVAVGSTPGEGSNEFDSAVVRFNTDGSLDTSFGNGGSVQVGFHTVSS